MKDAFGGAFMLKVMFVFFVIFITFMTVAINFARTFRVKDSIITILEKSNVTSKDKLYEKIDEYLKNTTYSYDNNKQLEDNCNEQMSLNDASKDNTSLISGYYRGICIVPKGSKDARYYKVSAYMVFSTPFFDYSFFAPISGETKIIYG